MYYQTINEFGKMLGNLNTLLDKAESHAKAKKFDTKVFLDSRLAPDMFAFVRQVQVACDNAKGAAARLAGVEIPKHEDNERSFDDLRGRIHKTIQFLGTLKADQFKDAEKRKIVLPWKEGEYLTAEEYLQEFAVPNFYFHVVTAYAILRHNGVDIGKMDYIGDVKFKRL